MTAPDLTPYATLTPHTILDAVERVGLRPDGRLLALGSFENRVYQLQLEDAPPVVVKFYRPGRWSDEAIGEEHRFVCDLQAAELPVVAPLTIDGRTLHHEAGFRFSISPRRGGRAPEFEMGNTLEWMGRFIARLHEVGARDRFTHRLQLTPQTFGVAARDFLLAHDCLPPDLLNNWRSAAGEALDRVQAAFEVQRDVALLRLHGDCHGGNVLWTDEGPHFVDFDDCLTGPAIQDLWMMLSGSREDREAQLGRLMAGYRCFRDFDPAELSLIEPLRTLRLLHYCAWIARRWGDPAFPAAFPWFNTHAYWAERTQELRLQNEAMQAPALRLGGGF